MLMTLGQLRGLILREMKLGVAGAEGDARAWGKKPLPDEPIYEPGKEGSEYIAMEDPPNYEPEKAIKALYGKRGAYDMAGDEINDELEDAHADSARWETVPSSPTGMRKMMPAKRAG